MNGIFNMNYITPTNIQASMLPLLVSDDRRNIICQSQTGTGKVEFVAFVRLSG